MLAPIALIHADKHGRLTFQRAGKVQCTRVVSSNADLPSKLKDQRLEFRVVGNNQCVCLHRMLQIG